MVSKKELWKENDKLNEQVINLQGKSLNDIKEWATEKEKLMEIFKTKEKLIMESSNMIFSQKDKIDELNAELKSKETYLECFKKVGIMTVDIPNTQNKEQADKVLGMVKERMDKEMERLGIDMDWIVMPSVVRDIKTITATAKREKSRRSEHG